MITAPTLTNSDLATFATILVGALAERAGIANASWWTARAVEHYPVGSTPEAFTPAVLAAAAAAGRLLTPGPRDIWCEVMPDGSAPLRSSRAIRCF